MYRMYAGCDFYQNAMEISRVDDSHYINYAISDTGSTGEVYIQIGSTLHYSLSRGSVNFKNYYKVIL